MLDAGTLGPSGLGAVSAGTVSCVCGSGHIRSGHIRSGRIRSGRRYGSRLSVIISRAAGRALRTVLPVISSIIITHVIAARRGNPRRSPHGLGRRLLGLRNPRLSSACHLGNRFFTSCISRRSPLCGIFRGRRSLSGCGCSSGLLLHLLRPCAQEIDQVALPHRADAFHALMFGYRF